MIKEYLPVVVTYRCGCCTEDIFARRFPRCRFHDEPNVMEGSDRGWEKRRIRKREGAATVHLSLLNYFMEKVDMDLSCVIIENPNALVKQYLRENADQLFILDNNTKTSYMEDALSKNYTLYLNCSIGAVHQNLRGMIHTPFLSTYRFITDANYRQVVTGEQPKPRGQLFK